MNNAYINALINETWGQKVFQNFKCYTQQYLAIPPSSKKGSPRTRNPKCALPFSNFRSTHSLSRRQRHHHDSSQSHAFLGRQQVSVVGPARRDDYDTSCLYIKSISQLLHSSLIIVSLMWSFHCVDLRPVLRSIAKIRSKENLIFSTE